MKLIIESDNEDRHGWPSRVEAVLSDEAQGIRVAETFASLLIGFGYGTSTVKDLFCLTSGDDSWLAPDSPEKI